MVRVGILTLLSYLATFFTMSVGHSLYADLTGITSILGYPDKPGTWLATSQKALWEFNSTSCSLLVSGIQETQPVSDLAVRCANSSGENSQQPLEHIMDIVHIDFTGLNLGIALTTTIAMADFDGNCVHAFDLESKKFWKLIDTVNSNPLLPTFSQSLLHPSQLIYFIDRHKLYVFATNTDTESYTKYACKFEDFVCTVASQTLSRTIPGSPIQAWRSKTKEVITACANNACLIKIEHVEYDRCIRTGTFVKNTLFFVNSITSGLESVNLQNFMSNAETSQSLLESETHCLLSPDADTKCADIKLLENHNSSYLLLLTSDGAFGDVNTTDLSVSYHRPLKYNVTTSTEPTPPRTAETYLYDVQYDHAGNSDPEHKKFWKSKDKCYTHGGCCAYNQDTATRSLESCAYTCAKRAVCYGFTYWEHNFCCRLCIDY